MHQLVNEDLDSIKMHGTAVKKKIVYRLNFYDTFVPCTTSLSDNATNKLHTSNM